MTAPGGAARRGSRDRWWFACPGGEDCVGRPDPGRNSAAGRLGDHPAVVAVSGLAALLHGRSRTPRGLAVTGAVSALTALSALFLGVLLAEG